MKTLIIPINSIFSEESLNFYRKLSSLLIGASSKLGDIQEQYFDEVIAVPPVTDPNFMAILDGILKKYDITNVVSHHPYVHAFLKKNLKQLPYEIDLDSMTTQEILKNRYTQNHILQETIKSRIGVSRYSTEIEKLLVTSLVRIEKIYGESSLDKLIKFAELVSSLPEGDIVEVGVFFGKSGYALSEFSSIFKKGKVLLVDSWDETESVQFSTDDSLAELSKSWDWDLVFNSFIMNLTEVSRNNNFNYLKKASVEASQIYTRTKSVASANFGTTNYLGTIALLHIDANHDYLNVLSDIKAWIPLVQNNGWVVFDDYDWALGDGVMLAVDEYISRNPDKIKESFKFCKSLFVKVKND